MQEMGVQGPVHQEAEQGCDLNSPDKESCDRKLERNHDFKSCFAKRFAFRIDLKNVVLFPDSWSASSLSLHIAGPRFSLSSRQRIHQIGEQYEVS